MVFRCQRCNEFKVPDAACPLCKGSGLIRVSPATKEDAARQERGRRQTELEKDLAKEKS